MKPFLVLALFLLPVCVHASDRARAHLDFSIVIPPRVHYGVNADGGLRVQANLKGMQVRADCGENKASLMVAATRPPSSPPPHPGTPVVCSAGAVRYTLSLP